MNLQGINKPAALLSLHVILMVALWWAASTITAIASKSVMEDKGLHTKKSRDWFTAPMLDLRWLELTMFQHFIGALVSVAWLKLILKKSIWPTAVEVSNQTIIMAALGNLLGNIGTNAAYSLVSSGMTQVVKCCEPLFTFFLSLVLYRHYQQLNITTFLSIATMVVGASLFVVYDSTFNILGLFAALCSAIAFPVRNIFLKKLNDVWESPFQKYAVLSLYGSLLLAPIFLVKMVFFQSSSLMSKQVEALVSSSFHCTYNIASIYVLQQFTPLTHAVLNLMKRGVVIAINVSYFHLPITWKMVAGLFAVLVGMFVYHMKTTKGTRSNFPSRILALLVLILLSLFIMPNRMLTNSKFSDFSECEKSMNPAVCTMEALFLKRSDIGNKTCINFINLTHHSPVATPQQQIYSSWVFNRPIPTHIVANIQTLSSFAPVHVFCGTSHCLDTINKLDSDSVTAEFLLMGDLVKDTPLQKWLARHSFYKVIGGKHFEKHLHQVVRLAILWKFGCLYVDADVVLLGEASSHFSAYLQKAWIGQMVGQPKMVSPDHGLNFGLACFPKHHSFIEQLANIFVEEYLIQSKLCDTGFNFLLSDQSVQAGFSLYNGDYPVMYNVCLSRLPTTDGKSHYGILSYDSRIRHENIANLGDEMQTFPGNQFLPFVDNFVDRDDLMSSNHSQNLVCFFNAWWGSSFIKLWPPPSHIDPILLSIHIHDGMKSEWIEHIDYARSRAPIGCRDLATLDFFRKYYVSAYFSGCLTLLVQNPNIGGTRTDDIFLVDIGDTYFNLLPYDIQLKGIKLYQDVRSPDKFNTLARYRSSFKLLEMYSTAKLVITQRIHAALPCVAMGTPVIFINADDLPGDVGKKFLDSPRLQGLSSLFHTLHVGEVGKEGISEWFKNFPWDNIPPNPDVATFMKLRATAWNVIRERSCLYDAGYKFGVIPLTVPEHCDRSMIFHYIFSSPEDQFNSYNQRSIESIFHHHPCSEVLVHSNTLGDHWFNVLRESGYSIEVKKYDMDSLLTEMAVNKLENDKWSHNKIHLLRLLVLYKWGGTYVDSNVIIVKPLNSLSKNTILWNSIKMNQVNSALIKLERNSSTLKSCFIKHTDVWKGSYESVDELFTQVFLQCSVLSDKDVHILDYMALYIFESNLSISKCYSVTSGKLFQPIKKHIKNESFGVYLPNLMAAESSHKPLAVRSNSFCANLLNDYCVLCNIIL